MHALSAAIRLRHLPVKSSNQNDYAAARRARPAAGIGMSPRTLRFLRAVRTHLTTARYVLLAALRSSGAPIRQHRRGRQPAVRITRLPTDRGSEHAHHPRAVDLLHAIEIGAATDALHSIPATTGPTDPEHVVLRQQRRLNRQAVRVVKRASGSALSPTLRGLPRRPSAQHTRHCTQRTTPASLQALCAAFAPLHDAAVQDALGVTACRRQPWP